MATETLKRTRLNRQQIIISRQINIIIRSTCNGFIIVAQTFPRVMSFSEKQEAIY